MLRMIRPACVLVLLAAAEARAGSDAWPGFRGDGTGVARADKLPLEWSPKTVAWKAALPGYGQSSPVVWKGRVFVTCIDGPNKEKNIVSAHALDTGKQLWSVTLKSGAPQKDDFTISKAAPTPCVDAGGLYVFFESGDLHRLTHDGKVVWSRSLTKDYGAVQNGHGLAASLAQTADLVIALVDDFGSAYLVGVDKKTGKDRWKADRPKKIAWASPVVTRQGGRDLVVVSAAGSVVVYDAATGKETSRYADVAGNTVPSAVVAGGRVVVGAGDSRGGQRELTLKSNCCLELNGGKLGAKPLWTGQKATSSFASPLVYAGCAYFLNQVGVLYCLDLKTGKLHYAERTGRSCWASPVGAAGRVYLFGRDGVTAVVKAGPKYQRLATNLLWDDREKPKERPAPAGMERFSGPNVYGTAVAGATVVVRTGSALFAVRGG